MKSKSWFKYWYTKSVKRRKMKKRQTAPPSIYMHCPLQECTHANNLPCFFFLTAEQTVTNHQLKSGKGDWGGESCCFHASFEAVPETGAFHLPTPLPSSNQSPHQMAAPIRYLKAQGYSLPVGSPKT